MFRETIRSNVRLEDEIGLLNRDLFFFYRIHVYFLCIVKCKH